MKSLFPIIILSAFWILGGTWWLANSFDEKETPISPFIFTDGSVRFAATDNFSFRYNSSEPILSDHTKAIFAKIVKYLNREEKTLNLEGLYTKTEKNDDDRFKNLGLARAAAIKKELVKLMAETSLISTTAQVVNKESFTDQTLYNGVNFIVSDKAVSNASLSAAMEAAKPQALSLEKAYFFNVEADDFKVEDYEGFDTYLEMLTTHLKNNSNAKIKISPFTNDASEIELAEKWGRKVSRAVEAFGINKAKLIKIKPAISLDAPDDRLFTRVEVELE
ncbi:MAG: hypothetical protein AB8G15_06195 [Saprospiraceae bacterium]